MYQDLHNEHVVQFYLTMHCDTFMQDDFAKWTALWLEEDLRNTHMYESTLSDEQIYIRDYDDIPF
mgnify:FL=1